MMGRVLRDREATQSTRGATRETAGSMAVAKRTRGQLCLRPAKGSQWKPRGGLQGISQLLLPGLNGHRPMTGQRQRQRSVAVQITPRILDSEWNVPPRARLLLLLSLTSRRLQREAMAQSIIQLRARELKVPAHPCRLPHSTSKPKCSSLGRGRRLTAPGIHITAISSSGTTPAGSRNSRQCLIPTSTGATATTTRRGRTSTTRSTLATAISTRWPPPPPTTSTRPSSSHTTTPQPRLSLLTDRLCPLSSSSTTRHLPPTTNNSSSSTTTSSSTLIPITSLPNPATTSIPYHPSSSSPDRRQHQHLPLPWNAQQTQGPGHTHS
mmetsp:Transcript_37027/g.104556  ORF Transcript_37027/g.104556 Transcript_37027/m.104556 type:complete len:323 (+) Transcript_37027:1155-2123(+)